MGGRCRSRGLIATTEAGTPAIGHVGFFLTGTRHYRNADKVVHLYNYLLAEAHKADHDTNEAFLVDNRASADSELVGPFRVGITLMLSAADGPELVDADGFPVSGRLEPGTDFYLRPAPGTSATTLTATAPGDLHGRVLTGVPLERGAQFTPIALAIPTEMAIEFDITWQAARACS